MMGMQKMVVIFSLPFLLIGCVDDKDSSCDVIANSNSSTFFKVKNKLSTGLEWYFTNSYAFGADMKSGECVKMGVSASQYTISYRQCNIGSGGGCSSSFGPEILRTFTVSQGKTHTVTVDSSFF